MIASTTRAAYYGARSELETEVEHILDGLDEHGGSYVSDDEPYPGFHGPWIYVDGGAARLADWLSSYQGGAGSEATP